MQSPFMSLVVGVAFAFLLTSIAGGQDRVQSDPRHVDASALEKRIAELEGKLSAIGKEVEELRREVRAQSSVAVVPLRTVDAKNAVEVIREVYRDHPEIEVTALAQTKSVIIQADEKMKGEIVDLLHRLDVPSQGKRVAEQRLSKPEKATRGRETGNRIMFPEAVERAMLMDAFDPVGAVVGYLVFLGICSLSDGKMPNANDLLFLLRVPIFGLLVGAVLVPIRASIGKVRGWAIGCFLFGAVFGNCAWCLLGAFIPWL